MIITFLTRVPDSRDVYVTEINKYREDETVNGIVNLPLFLSPSLSLCLPLSNPADGSTDGTIAIKQWS